jgi:8-oxo-dGTP diphosphatase
MGRRIPCAGVVISRADGRIVSIRRAHEPSVGLWSIPGGRVESGETAEQAARREACEETGLEVLLGALLGHVELPHGADVYVVSDFAATVVGDPDGLRAGDDASDARWVTHDEILMLDCSPGLIETLTGWGLWGS